MDRGPDSFGHQRPTTPVTPDRVAQRLAPTWQVAKLAAGIGIYLRWGAVAGMGWGGGREWGGESGESRLSTRDQRSPVRLAACHFQIARQVQVRNRQASSPSPPACRSVRSRLAGVPHLRVASTPLSYALAGPMSPAAARLIPIITRSAPTSLARALGVAQLADASRAAR